MTEWDSRVASPAFDGTQTVRDSRPDLLDRLDVEDEERTTDPTERGLDDPTDPAPPPSRVPEDADTEIDVRLAAGAAASQVAGELSIPDRELSIPDRQDLEDAVTTPLARRRAAEEAARQVPASLSRSVELSGQEAEAARLLAEEQRKTDGVGETTAEIDPRRLPRLTHECRMCGQKITAPRMARFNVLPGTGHRCGRCQNVFCGDHVVRVSGFFETLLSGARFSCQLCLPANAPAPSPTAAEHEQQEAAAAKVDD